MIEADRVLSTPPLNTSSTQEGSPSPESLKAAERLSRRGALAGLAALSLAPTAAAVTIDKPDPAFALIAAMRAAHIAHGAAIDAQDEAESRYGRHSQEAWDADEACGAACHKSQEVAWQIATAPPATLAGIAAVLRFSNEFEDGGDEWPDTDRIGRDGWHYQLRATMAAAIEAIIRKGGKA